MLAAPLGYANALLGTSALPLALDTGALYEVAKNQIYNLDGNRKVTIKEIAETVRKILGDVNCRGQGASLFSFVHLSPLSLALSSTTPHCPRKSGNGVRFENYQYSSHHPLGIDEFGLNIPEYRLDADYDLVF